jgi:hypothetical protein
MLTARVTATKANRSLTVLGSTSAGRGTQLTVGRKEDIMDMVKSEKYMVPVRLTLLGGVQAYGVVFLEKDQRILDMICGEKQFFPFKSSRSLSIMNKLNVLQIDVLPVEEMKELEKQFPKVDFHYLTNNQW